MGSAGQPQGRWVRIGGVDVEVFDDEVTGAELKQLGGVPQDRVLVRQERDRNVIVPDHQRLRVAGDDVFTHHAHHSKAASAWSPGTAPVRDARVLRECAVLRRAYPGLEIAPDRSWVLIPGFRLPRGWEPDETTVLIEPPTNYPEAAPDGFHLGARLRRRGLGRALRDPGHYFRGYKNRYADRGYFWYCLEDPDRRWDPRHDSLITFVEAIRTYLGTAD